MTHSKRFDGRAKRTYDVLAFAALSWLLYACHTTEDPAGQAGQAGQAGASAGAAGAAGSGAVAGSGGSSTACTATCDGECFDLRNDPAHCGKCSVHCEAGSFCQNGVCEPGAGQVGAGCSQDSDCESSHCLDGGHCSKACTGSADCPASSNWSCDTAQGGGWCTCTATLGAETCNDVDSNCDGLVDNGAVCSEPRFTCQSGNCACAPENVCGSLCVDTYSDPSHCGTCSKTCVAACVSTFCVGVTAVTTGAKHTCAILENGTVRCWGDATQGALGVKNTTSGRIPLRVEGLDDITSISAGFQHTCASSKDGTVSCWGQNTHGQLGIGGSLTESPTPATLDSISGVTQVASGKYHTCALLNSGEVSCWGDNTHGQLGKGDKVSSSRPAPVNGLTGVTSIAAGYQHVCALLGSGSVVCWGDDVKGELGNGMTTDTTGPVTVKNLSGVTSITAGNFRTCAVTADGGARCWGQKEFSSDNSVRLVPVVIEGLSNVARLSTSDKHTCAVLTDGTARCMGVNDDGQLGNGSTTWSSVPVTVTALAGATDIAVGSEHSCAVLTDASVRCWGQNDEGELGTNTVFGSKVIAPVVWY